jgi:hypothetical protein
VDAADGWKKYFGTPADDDQTLANIINERNGVVVS